MLVNMHKLLAKARKKRYAVAAPGVNDLQTITAVFAAAAELKAPIILDCFERNDLEGVAEIAKFVSRRYPHIPAALNLDHGTSFEVCARAIKAGFSSVMIDYSHKPFSENVRITAEVVKMAHAVGVSVEAELGYLGTAAELKSTQRESFTKPKEAVEFVQKTSVDCLAVAVGTAHGLYKTEKPQLDLRLIAELRDCLAVPLVLHGGSSSGDEQLVQAIRSGISKINLFSDLSSAGYRGGQSLS